MGSAIVSLRLLCGQAGKGTANMAAWSSEELMGQKEVTVPLVNKKVSRPFSIDLAHASLQGINAL